MPPIRYAPARFNVGSYDRRQLRELYEKWVADGRPLRKDMPLGVADKFRGVVM